MLPNPAATTAPQRKELTINDHYAWIGKITSESGVTTEFIGV
jgi:hypothetical protein